MKKVVFFTLFISITFCGFAGQTQNPQNRNNNSVRAQRINPDGERYPDININNPEYLPPRQPLGTPNKKYYIDRAGNHVYYGKPVQKGTINTEYKVDGLSFRNAKYSVRYFFTPRITDDDIFDNLRAKIDGTNYRGQIAHDFRLLNRGNPYHSSTSPREMPPRTFIRFEIKTPEGTKYVVLPSLNQELLYPLSKEEMLKRFELVIKSFNYFRSGVNDIMLHERLRYSAYVWITLKRSRYRSINADKIIWHFYQKPILKEQNYKGNINDITRYLKKKNFTINKERITGYFKNNNYLQNPNNADYYIIKFRLNDYMQYIIIPVSKIYHNVLNRPIKEIATYFARKYLKKPQGSKIICGKEEPIGKWQFITLN